VVNTISFRWILPHQLIGMNRLQNLDAVEVDVDKTDLLGVSRAAGSLGIAATDGNGDAANSNGHGDVNADDGAEKVGGLSNPRTTFSDVSGAASRGRSAGGNGYGDSGEEGDEGGGELHFGFD